MIINWLTGRMPHAAGVPHIGELTFLLQSGPDRIGALDFQASPTEYVPRLARADLADKEFELDPGCPELVRAAPEPNTPRRRACAAR